MQNVIYKDDQEYPSLLKKIGKDAPKQLYFKVLNQRRRPENDALVFKGHHSSGQASSYFKVRPVHLFENCLAVVGSRKLTHYGEQVIEKIIGEVASPRSAGQAGITIVSGFMYGGDALAHQVAVRVGGRTIAVMPCGINRISPEDQEELYNDIIENNGMIISEYEGEMAPALWTYPRRNRIVAGLSKAVLVIEAGEKSGSLITANLAKKFKRKIFAVPGPITSSVSIGTNMLIKQGAEMVTDAKDILRWFKKIEHRVSRCHSRESGNPVKNNKVWIPNQVGNDREVVGNDRRVMSENDESAESQILSFLEREPLGIDEMSRDLEISVSELGVKLSMMEMQGLIELKGDKYYNVK